MRSLRFTALALAAASFALIAAPASADEVVSVAPFKSISLHGGGLVTIKHGDTQRVTITNGSTRQTGFHIRADGSDTLEIETCAQGCPHQYDLEIEIVTPAILGVSVHGGGDIETAGAFPVQPSLNAAVHGGGIVNMRGLEANQVNAAVHGGGEVMVNAKNQLNAAVHGGGEITYWGHPVVSRTVRSGGSISHGS